MSEKDSEELRKDLVKIEVKLIKSEIRFLKFMLKMHDTYKIQCLRK